MPCIPAIKHLNELAEKFKDKPVQFIAVTDEDGISLVTKFLREQPIRGWVGLDTDGSVFVVVTSLLSGTCGSPC